MTCITLAILTYNYYCNESGPIWRGNCVDEIGNNYILDVQDKILDSTMYILEKDKDIFIKGIKENHLDYCVLSVEKSNLPTALEEPTLCIKTKFPYQVRVIRDAMKGLLTFNADIKWEKKVVQQMKWKQFLDVTDFNPYNFTPLKNIKVSEKRFYVKQNMSYWDIETDITRAKGNWRQADKIPIISYVLISRKMNELIYYSNRSDFKLEVLYDNYNSVLPEETIKKLKQYPKSLKRIIKLFPTEKEMHIQFITDFGNYKFHGIMTFNGRGGNRITRGKRTWFDGYDMPMFYERCRILGLEKEIQYMSPIPSEINERGIIIDRSVKVQNMFNKLGEITKFEVFIKGLPQHDLYFDDNVLFYSKNQYEMKRHRLEDFMQFFLKVGKIQHAGMVHELFNQNWKEEMHYNSVDVEGLLALDTQLKYTDEVMGRAAVYASQIEDVVYASKLHDHISLWYISDQYVMDTRGNDREETWEGMVDGKQGGFNLSVKKEIIGYHDIQFIALFDFSSLYPMCSITVNCDQRTKINLKCMHLNKEGLFLEDTVGRRFLWNSLSRSPSGFFRKDIKSLDSIIYKDLIEGKNKYKKLKYDSLRKYKQTNDEQYSKESNMYADQYLSYKGLVNGKFGSSGAEGTRCYDKVIYNTPSTMGQEIIQYTLALLQYKKYKPIFASTDSTIVVLTSKNVKEAWDEASKLSDFINIEISRFVMKEFNPDECHINIGCERIADLAIMFDKRRYILNVVVEDSDEGPIYYSKPRLYFKGVEQVRRDSALITTEVQKNLIEMICQKKDLEFISKYLNEVNNNYKDKEWSYICGRSGISNELDKGDEGNQRYKACLNANKILGKNYNAGDNPLMGIFPIHPIYFNNQYLEPGVLAMAFDEEDEKYLKDSKFDLDYDEIKETHLVNKVDPFLTFFETSYYEITSMQRRSVIRI